MWPFNRQIGSDTWQSLLVAALVLPASCTPPDVDEPIAVMVDRQAGYGLRRHAAELAEQRMPDDPRRIAALHDLLWQPRYPAWQRRYAIEQLLVHDPQFKAKLQRRIVLLQNPETRREVFDLAVRRGWKDFTPALVRAYAQPSRGTDDLERPERAAIEKLNPGRSVEEILFDVFAWADDSHDRKQQEAAWALLSRLCPQDELAGMLQAAPADSPLAADLKAAAAELGVLPVNREGILWLSDLRKPKHRSFWERARAAVAALGQDARAGLELRHLPMLVKGPANLRSQSRSELTSRITGRLARHEHHLKGPTYDAPMSQHPQRFEDWQQILAWADLATIHLMLDLLEDADMTGQLFAQADKDLADQTTEHGGVIDLEAGRPVARGYAPITRVHRWKYVPSPIMIEHLYTAVAHYHFHAQADRNSRHAGPGLGDLRMAETLGPSAVVFTFITPDTLNVDYYQKDQVVVDLGTIHR
jgi:hypothetical protein